MAKYKSIVVTNGGLALVAAAHSGDTIEFTAVKTGAGVYDGTEVLAEATDLKDLKQTMGITGITKDDNVIKIRAVLSNEGLDEAYKITELGLYAKDSSGNEVLYAIVIAETGMEDYLPAYADAPTGITMEMYIDATAYESGVTFQATVIAGIYATVEDLNDSVSSINSRIVTMESSIMQEINKKVNISDIVDNLESTDDKVPLSAKQGNKLKEAISPIINGVSLTNHDFNDLGDKPLIGIGNNMINAPFNNPSVVYHVVHIPAYNNFAVTQYAKAINMSEGEVLFFRQRRNNGTWDNWYSLVISELLAWKYLTLNDDGRSYTDLPANANELSIIVNVRDGNNTYYFHSIHLTNFKSIYHTYRFYDGYSKAQILINFGKVLLASAHIGDTDVTSTSTLTVAYR